MTIRDPIMTDYSEILDDVLNEVQYDEMFNPESLEPTLDASPLTDDFTYLGVDDTKTFRIVSGFEGINLRRRYGSLLTNAQTIISSALLDHVKSTPKIFTNLTKIVSYIREHDNLLMADLADLKVRLSVSEFTLMIITRMIDFFVYVYSSDFDTDITEFTFAAPAISSIANYCGFYQMYHVRVTSNIEVIKAAFAHIINRMRDLQYDDNVYPPLIWVAPSIIYQDVNDAMFTSCSGEVIALAVNDATAYSDTLSKETIMYARFICKHWDVINPIGYNYDSIVDMTVSRYLDQFDDENDYFRKISFDANDKCTQCKLGVRDDLAREYLISVNSEDIIRAAIMTTIQRVDIPVTCVRVNNADYGNSDCKLCCDHVAEYRCSQCSYPMCSSCVRQHFRLSRKCPCCRAEGDELKLYETMDVDIHDSLVDKSFIISSDDIEFIESFNPYDVCEDATELNQFRHLAGSYVPNLRAILTRQFAQKLSLVTHVNVHVMH